MNADEQPQPRDGYEAKAELSGDGSHLDHERTERVRADALGDPLTIADVAALLGCSAWTVRQRYLRQGLPYLRARPRGKLVFFRKQVIAWTLKRQLLKGGMLR